MKPTIQNAIREVHVEPKNVALTYLWITPDATRDIVHHFLVSYKEDDELYQVTKVVRKEKLIDWFNQTTIPFNAKIHSGVLLIDFLTPNIFGSRFVSIRPV